MPIEHEIKHVLSDPEGRLLAFLRAAAAASVSDPAVGDIQEQAVHQFYLTRDNRLRKTVWRTGSHVTTEFTHTFKMSIEGRLLEIESSVTPADFEMALPAGNEHVVKTRFKVSREDAHWDIDFLMERPGEDGGSVYFAMAEAELEEGGQFAVPDFLAPFVELVVPHGDSTWFTNRKLADQDYAKSVLRDYRWFVERRPSASA